MQNAILLNFNQNATSSSFFSPTHQQICTGPKIIIGYSSVVPPVRIYIFSYVVSYVELILSSLAISHKLEKWICSTLLSSSLINYELEITNYELKITDHKILIMITNQRISYD